VLIVAQVRAQVVNAMESHVQAMHVTVQNVRQSVTQSVELAKENPAGKKSHLLVESHRLG
jgi:uncharacterized alkaline shock family protein YloU